MNNAHRDIYRIIWRLRDTGMLNIGGAGVASNYGTAVEPGLVAKLNECFHDIEFILEIFDRDLNMWGPATDEEQP